MKRINLPILGSTKVQGQPQSKAKLQELWFQTDSCLQDYWRYLKATKLTCRSFFNTIFLSLSIASADGSLAKPNKAQTLRDSGSAVLQLVLVMSELSIKDIRFLHPFSLIIWPLQALASKEIDDMVNVRQDILDSCTAFGLGNSAHVIYRQI